MPTRTAIVVGLALAVGCSRTTERSPAQVLLFDGTGVSRGSVKAWQSVLERRHLSYECVDSAELNAMTAGRLRQYRLLIVPGGNYLSMGRSLGAETGPKVRRAVESGGLNYLSVCADGLLAGKPDVPGFDLAGGRRFDFYSVVNQGIHKAAVSLQQPAGPPMEHYWEAGPQFTGWGNILARYPNGTPAIVEAAVGKGWVILSGVHPEASEAWRQGMSFTQSAQTANDYAATLVEAALNRKELPHF